MKMKSKQNLNKFKWKQDGHKIEFNLNKIKLELK